MKNSGFGHSPQDYVSATRHSCPVCSAALVRTPRRPVDYLISRFTPVQRFRCERFSCQWQGNLRVGQADTSVDSLPAR
jgi:hypothetical protein